LLSLYSSMLCSAFVGASASILIALTFTLLIGNWTATFIAVAQPSFVRRSFPWNWFVYLPVLFAVGLTGSFLAYVISFVLWFPARSDFIAGLTGNLRIGTLMTLMFGIITFLVAEQRLKLEVKNIELQRRVLIGEQEIKTRAAELDHAREIQVHLLPRETPQLPGFSIACAWQPATAVSGDYFDVFPLNDGRMAFCIADVSGKGVGAALVMANVQASLRAFAHTGIGPAHVCAALKGRCPTTLRRESLSRCFMAFWIRGKGPLSLPTRDTVFPW
jgi:sigma-B regulation protein RsbU (phosphoserine phosphatase)